MKKTSDLFYAMQVEVIEVYINIYLCLYTFFFFSNYIFYLVRGNKFRLLMQPSSGQLKVEQEP